MKDTQAISGYSYDNAATSCAHEYLMPVVESILERHFAASAPADRRVFDVGCGNGSVTSLIANRGYDVHGIDPSTTGIEQARNAYSKLRFDVGSAYDPLVEKYGQWPAVISLEVVEHVYAPRDYAKTIYDLIEPGGVALISTPYHSYFKNVALALSGKMDAHFTALWDHGHIKFWSVRTLSQLLVETGFSIQRVQRVGRIKTLAKSMILVAGKD